MLSSPYILGFVLFIYEIIAMIISFDIAIFLSGSKERTMATGLYFSFFFYISQMVFIFIMQNI